MSGNRRYGRGHEIAAVDFVFVDATYGRGHTDRGRRGGNITVYKAVGQGRKNEARRRI